MNQSAQRVATAAPSLKARALRLLSMREYSRLELEKKLAVHENQPGELSAVLDALQAKDFINPARVAEWVVNRRSARLGSARIRQELLQKGLDAEVVLAAMAPVKATELERAQALWEKKFGSGSLAAARAASKEDAAPLTSEQQADDRMRQMRQMRQMRFLAARGFSSDAIAKVMRSQGRGPD